MTELGLLNNTIVALSSDHGMHVGEKGMWEKYTLFEETTRVPLLISDPRYTMQWGSRHPFPVELIDLVPTLLDLLGADPLLPCHRDSSRASCVPMDGHSLADVVSNRRFQSPILSSQTTHFSPANPSAPFAISQMQRCVGAHGHKRSTKRRQRLSGPVTDTVNNRYLHVMWDDVCDEDTVRSNKTTVGYSLRTADWRYTCWFRYNSQSRAPSLSSPPLMEELYDHSGSGCGDFESRETVNLAYSPLEGDGKGDEGRSVRVVLATLRMLLVSHLRNSSYSMREARARYLARAHPKGEGEMAVLSFSTPTT